jgi:hypothetical protein
MRRKRWKDRSEEICDECMSHGIFKMREWPHESCREAALHEFNRGFQEAMNEANDTEDLIY